MDILLNDPRMIRQCLQMFECEIEPLYWGIEDRAQKGKINEARGIFIMMAYIAKYNKPLLKRGLKKAQKLRLKQLSYELFDEAVPTYKEPVVIRSSISPVNLPFKKELELQEYLSRNPQILSEALEEEVQITGTEVEADCEYRCDITAESESTFYTIELKIGQTTHAVVSQCNKYCWYFYRKLRYGQHKDVQGVVIGNGMDEWSINELRREGIWCFCIIPVSETDIRLERIENDS